MIGYVDKKSLSAGEGISPSIKTIYKREEGSYKITIEKQNNEIIAAAYCNGNLTAMVFADKTEETEDSFVFYRNNEEIARLKKAINEKKIKEVDEIIDAWMQEYEKADFWDKKLMELVALTKKAAYDEIYKRVEEIRQKRYESLEAD